MDNITRWDSDPKGYLDGVIAGIGGDRTRDYGECMRILNRN